MENNKTPKSSELMYRYLPLTIILMAFLLLSGSLFLLGDSSDSLPSASSQSESSVKNNASAAKTPSEVLVVIDAGHGGNDNGAAYGSVLEKEINLGIALKLGPLLKTQNIKFIYTREKDIYVSLADRAELANKNNASLFISIHNNKMPGSSSFNGTETLYAAAVSNRFETMSDKRLASIIQHELTDSLKTTDQGIKYRPELAVLHRTAMPAVIAEIGYLSNKSDRSKLSSDAFRQKTAEALAKAILKALEEMGAYRDDSGKLMIMEK